MNDSPVEPSAKWRSRIAPFFASMVIVFVCETLTMIIIDFFDVKGPMLPIIDSSILFVLSLPFLHIFVFKRLDRTLRLMKMNRCLHEMLSGVWNTSFPSQTTDQLMGRMLSFIMTTPYLAKSSKGAICLKDENGTLRMAASVGDPASVPCECLDGGRSRHPDCLTLPIIAEESVSGVLSVCHGPAQEIGDEELRFLELTCGTLSKIIEFKRLEEKSFHLQKLETLGYFSGAVAHDFNNILSIIKGYNTAALETAKPGSDMHSCLSASAESISRGVALAHEMLGFSRRGGSELSELDVNDFLRSIQDLTATLMRRRSRVELDLAPGLPKVLANRARLEQVLFNLAANARDAMPEGGVLTLTTRKLDRADGDILPDELEGCRAAVKISVQDTGGGMDDEAMRHAFQPLFSTKGDAGTGLGLFTAYGIIRQHNGAIQVSSRPGEGTTFDVYLPVPEPRSAAAGT